MTATSTTLLNNDKNSSSSSSLISSNTAPINNSHHGSTATSSNNKFNKTILTNTNLLQPDSQFTDLFGTPLIHQTAASGVSSLSSSTVTSITTSSTSSSSSTRRKISKLNNVSFFVLFSIGFFIGSRLNGLILILIKKRGDIRRREKRVD